MPRNTKDTKKPDSQPKSQPEATPLNLLIRLLKWAAGLATAGMLALLMVIALALSVAYPNLPDVSDMLNYRPKLPMRVFSADGALIGEFGEERRSLTPIKDIPQVMKDAVLANPFSRDSMDEAIDKAIDMPEEERRARMQSLLAHVKKYDIGYWTRHVMAKFAKLTASGQ